MKNASLQSMKQMKMEGMASAYEAVLSLPINKQPEPHQMLAQLIDAEQQHRAHKMQNPEQVVPPLPIQDVPPLPEQVVPF